MARRIAQANAGISIEQLPGRDAKDAVVTARRFFAYRSVESVMAAMNEKDNHQNNQKEDAVTRVKNVSKRLKLAEVQLFGSSVMMLFDLGTVPGVMSLRPCHRLHAVQN